VAISTGILVKIILVVFLGCVEVPERHELYNKRSTVA
jgi:hypothetical protein